jgi:hypothetical protein
MYFLFLYIFALHVSGAICTHPQEYKLQSKAIGMFNLWKAEVINSIKRCGILFYLHEFVGIYFLWLCSPARAMVSSYHEVS